MKCLIIVVRCAHEVQFSPKTASRGYNYDIPVGLAYISASLKQSGHKISFLNLNHCDGIVDDIIKDRLSTESYDFVITGGISPLYAGIKYCVDSVRRWSPSARIILGGGMISSQPEIMFNLLQPDYGVVGEGELTIKELFECFENKWDINTVNGLIFRNVDGQTILTSSREPIKDLDLLPSPDYEGLGFEEYLDNMLPSDVHYYSIFDKPRAYPIIASRSCPFSCTFCFHPLGKKYRKRSIDNVIAELDYAIKRYKINLIVFYDELFANDRSRVKEFCRRLTELFNTVPWEVKWFCQMRVDVLDEEIIVTMKKAGCYCLSLGLESYSSTILKSMNKHITPQQIDAALKLCRYHNIAFTGNFIFGDIMETTETYRETIRYWKENRTIIANQVILGVITLYQGSPIYKHALEKGIINNEIKFIEDRAANKGDIVNFTDRMTDVEFQEMLREINEANIVMPLYSEPLLNTKINGIPEVHVKCPFCKCISIYKNISVPPLMGFQDSDRRLLALICRKCNARIRLITKHENVTINIYRFFGFKNGAIIIRYILSPPLYLLRNFNKLIHKFIS
jgi:anaerobic magnesium-protoporphyrin IX monomethyl ester cyclase